MAFFFASEIKIFRMSVVQKTLILVNLTREATKSLYRLLECRKMNFLSQSIDRSIGSEPPETRIRWRGKRTNRLLLTKIDIWKSLSKNDPPDPFISVGTSPPAARYRWRAKAPRKEGNNEKGQEVYGRLARRI